MPDRRMVIDYLKWAIAEAELTGHTSITLEPLKDALALLKEQEPRVMKPEEIPDYNGAIYLEDFGEPEIVIAVYDRGVAGRVKFAIRGTRSTIAGYDDYNKRWRAWTSRPTEEQRENTPWEPPKEEDDA